ncbi:MAG TPA: hypothetical protein VGC99_17940, partial [Candidatus Tectomicrobia bacterium]
MVSAGLARVRNAGPDTFSEDGPFKAPRSLTAPRLWKKINERQTLLVKSQPLISKAMGVSFSRGMYSASLDIKRHR